MIRKIPTLLAATLIVPIAGLAAFTGQHQIDSGETTVMRGNQPITRGSGRLVTRARTLPPFSRIVADDGADVSIAFGPTQEVSVQADDNLIDRVTTRVENGTLWIGVGGSYRTRATPTASIVVPALERIDLHASGSARVAGMRGSALALSSNGSGNFIVDGDIGELRVELFGSGEADLARLRAEHVRVELNGSGEARVHASRSLRAEVNGSGTILYAGAPERSERAVNGAGTIRPLGR